MTLRLLRSTLLIALLALAGTTFPAQAQGQLYWSDQGRTTLETANVDGSGHQVLATGATPVLVALDAAADVVYHIDRDDGTIYRTNLDGTGTETLVDRAYVSLSGITTDAFVVDVDGGAMYWSEPDSNRIRTASLDGSGSSDLITADDGLAYPTGLALDAENGKLYFINSDANTIQRANLDGSDIEDVIVDDNAALSLAVDPGGGKLYWARPREDEIMRANLDGTDAEVILEGPSRTRFGQPALTLAGDSLYFNEPGGFTGGGAIHRVHVDGSGLEEIVPGEHANDPTDLFVAGDQLYWAAGYLYRSALDGANPERILDTMPMDVKVDVDAGWAFWLNQRRELMRADLDGSAPMVLLDDLPVSNLDELALDREAQRVYYTGGGVYRVDYDGQNEETLVTNEFTTSGIVVDPADEMVYWIGNSSGTLAWLKRASFDGTGEETLLENLDYARGLTLDASSDKLYWAYGGSGDTPSGARQAGLDGTDSTTVLTTSGTLIDLAFGADGHLYWADSEDGTIGRTNPGDQTTETLVTGLATPYGLDVAGTTGTSVIPTGEPPSTLVLSPNYPNPFGNSTSVRYALPEAAHVRVDVFDALGRRVAVLVDTRQAAGSQMVHFDADAADLSGGVYFYRVQAGTRTATRRMVLVR